ncbi:MAG: hypothetical protein ACRCZJ_04680 [Erysipelotrichaceae bacterium]
MILVDCPAKKDYVIETLEAISEPCTFKLLGQKGITLQFACSIDDPSSVDVAKKAIKSTNLGSVLYVQVRYAKNEG